MEFKVGDIVRCVNVDGDDTQAGVGTRSAITSIDGNASWPINAVDIDGDFPGLAVAYTSSELVLVYREEM